MRNRQTLQHRAGGKIHRRAARGLSLIEMMIAVTIVGLLAAIVAPSMGTARVQTLEAVARKLAADCSLARHAAIQYGTEWTVQFDVTQNAYTLTHTGTGTVPPLRNPVAGAIAAGTPYRVELDALGAVGSRTNGVRLAGVALASGGQSVTSVTFGPQGGTGPQRSVDTVIWLIQGTGSETRYLRLTISWVSGQVWVDRPSAFMTATDRSTQQTQHIS